MVGNHFLSFNSFVDSTKNVEDLLFDATIRFVYKFAKYEANFNLGSTDTANGGSSVDTQLGGTGAFDLSSIANEVGNSADPTQPFI